MSPLPNNSRTARWAFFISATRSSVCWASARLSSAALLSVSRRALSALSSFLYDHRIGAKHVLVLGSLPLTFGDLTRQTLDPGCVAHYILLLGGAGPA